MYYRPTWYFQSNTHRNTCRARLAQCSYTINQNLQQVQNHIHPYPQMLERIKEVLLQISSMVFVFFLSVAFVVILLWMLDCTKCSAYCKCLQYQSVWIVYWDFHSVACSYRRYPRGEQVDCRGSLGHELQASGARTD